MIEQWVLSFGLVLARVGMFVAAMPLFGGRNLPRLLKLGLALGLSTLWFGRVRLSPEIFHASGSVHLLAYAVAMGRELILGAVLGYAFGLLLLPARIAGAFVGQEMGLTLATITDPSSDQRGNAMSQLFETLAILIFFGLDMHHVLLAALHSTFARWPIGGATGPVPVAPMVGGLSLAHQWGMLLAAPLAFCLFLSVVLLTLLARAAPQLNLLTVGFSMRLIVGLVAALLLLPNLVVIMSGVFGRVVELLGRFI